MSRSLPLAVLTGRSCGGTMNRDELLQRQGEQGGARLKFIIALVAFAIVIYVGYMYIPVAYDAYYFKDVMQNTVDMAAAQGRDTSWATDQLKKTETDNHVPSKPIIAPPRKAHRIQACVQVTPPN